MPSPFPGMNPFLEFQEWEDFHTTFNTVAREVLSPQVEPAYVVRVERRVYVEHSIGGLTTSRRADVAVLIGSTDSRLAASSTVCAALAPVECELPMPEEQRETYLVVRHRETQEVVTILETLSPANKRAGADGRREYLKKREEVLSSQAHLVEFDLLLGGERLPMATTLPPGDYYAVVSRSYRRPKADVYSWGLPQVLPAIPVPLKKGDDDVLLDLQQVVNTVYDRANYDLSLDYQQPLPVTLDEAHQVWIADTVRD